MEVTRVEEEKSETTLGLLVKTLGGQASLIEKLTARVEDLAVPKVPVRQSSPMGSGCFLCGGHIGETNAPRPLRKL